MMTIAARGDAETAAAYYGDHLDRGDYYTASPGSWWGSNATRTLGVSDAVNKADFTFLTEGRGVDGSSLVQRHGVRHRAGWDATFSSVKSVSVLWSQLTGAKRQAIEDAQARAVATALGFLEKKAIRVRVGKGGAAHVQSSMVAACFAHETSRAMDPQLHTHAFVMNCALRPDGRFGAIESSHIFAWQTAAGTVYRAQLADELRRIGYWIDADERAFRIRNVPIDACTYFSKRRSEIEDAVAARGSSSPASYQAATLATRGEKVDVAPTELYQRWREEGRSIGFGPVEAEALSGPPDAQLQPIDIPGILLKLTEYAAVFRAQDLWREVAERVQVAGGGISRIESIVRDILQGEEIVSLPESRFSTQTMLDLEQRALAAARRLAGQAENGCQARHSELLSPEQLRALTHVLAEGGIRIVEGRAGTGKSYFLGPARKSWEDAGFEVIGAALAGKAAQGLQEGSGIPAQTLHSLIAELEAGKRRIDPRTVLVIDEVGMVGTRQIEQLLSLAAAAHSKVILVGDSKQLQSIEAGGVFRRLSQELGAAELVDIRRQRDEADRSVVVSLMEGRAGEALENLEARGRVHVKDGQPAVIGAIVQAWLDSADPANPAASLMLAATRADVRLINAEARRRLRDRGNLGSASIAVGGSEFSTGDRVLFLRNDRAMGVKNGTLGTVKRVDENGLTIELDDRREVSVNPQSYPNLTYGYAITAHKAQGVTTDRVYVFLSDRMTSREWGYVAGSRHRDELHLFADRSVYASMAKDLSRSRPQTMALDEMPEFGTSPDANPQPDPVLASPTSAASDYAGPVLMPSESGSSGATTDTEVLPDAGTIRTSKSVVEVAAAEFKAGYQGAIDLAVAFHDRGQPAPQALDPQTVFVETDPLDTKSDVLDAIERSVRKRHGLRLLPPAEREAILRAIVQAADDSPGIRAAWQRVNLSTPGLPALDRAEKVFEIAASAADQGILGKAWDAILQHLDRCLRLVGLLRSPVTMVDLRSIAREIADGNRATQEPSIAELEEATSDDTPTSVDSYPGPIV
jgi:conjugative relaxase-like TrwC/TraI family protein